MNSSMAGTWSPGTLPLEGTAAPLETRINRGLAFGAGLLLAVLTLSTQYIGTPTDIISRIAPVDFLCVAFLAVLFIRHRMRMPPWTGLVYLAAVGLALVPALLISPGPEMEVWIQGAAILMAFGFYLLGLTLGDSPVLLRWLLAGLCVAVLAEAVLVYHDSLVPHGKLWFPDPMEHRVRGTFKTNGQLGAFGFCAAGFLVTFGATIGSPVLRRICVATALLAASFVFLASRRTGMLAVFAWGGLFAFLGWRFRGERFYNLFLAGFLLVLLLIGIFWPQIESSFAGRRFRDAMSSLGAREGFIHEQLHESYSTSDKWLPLGFGVGRGYHINPAAGFEVHNCFLAVLIELGVLGFFGWLGMVIHPLVRKRWHQISPEHQRLGVLLTSFMVISVLFMFHNTLYRDRTFLLFLGVATTLVARETRLGSASNLFDAARARTGSPRVSWSGP